MGWVKLVRQYQGSGGLPQFKPQALCCVIFFFILLITKGLANVNKKLVEFGYSVLKGDLFERQYKNTVCPLSRGNCV